jgi:hypothetical protein
MRPTQASKSLAAIPDSGRSDVPTVGFRQIPSHGSETPAPDLIRGRTSREAVKRARKTRN